MSISIFCGVLGMYISIFPLVCMCTCSCWESFLVLFQTCPLKTFNLLLTFLISLDYVIVFRVWWVQNLLKHIVYHLFGIVDVLLSFLQGGKVMFGMWIIHRWCNLPLQLIVYYSYAIVESSCRFVSLILWEHFCSYYS